MATITAINSKHSKSHGSLSGTLNYCLQDSKTVWEGEKLVGTLNCVAGSAYREFINTKQMFGKDEGQMYFHFVISFPDSEKITPKQCHEYAMEFAKRKWDSFEVVACTHSDNDHIHTHFIINSVCFENGKRFHSDQKLIHDLHKLNDQMCLQYGYMVTGRRPKDERVSVMRTSEYHSAMKGESWKMELRIAIDEAMKYAVSRRHFIEIMNSEGYFVRWEKDRKSITYTCPNGMKCRGEKLNDKKYLKEAMENEFRIRQETVYGGNKEQGESERGHGGGNADDGNSYRSELGSAEQFGDSARGSGDTEHRRYPAVDNGAADEGVSGRADTKFAVGLKRDGVECGSNAVGDAGDAEQPVGQSEDADGGSYPVDFITGWEGEREFFLSVFRNEGRHEKMAEKNHVDRAHTIGAGLRPGTAVLNTLSGLRQVFGDSDRPYDPDADDDDIDKELRRQERVVTSRKIEVFWHPRSDLKRSHITRVQNGSHLKNG